MQPLKIPGNQEVTSRIDFLKEFLNHFRENAIAAEINVNVLQERIDKGQGEAISYQQPVQRADGGISWKQVRVKEQLEDAKQAFDCNKRTCDQIEKLLQAEGVTVE